MIRSTRKITTTLTAAAASVALIFGVTACGASDDDCQGDPGKVSDKEYEKATKTDSTADYDLTIVRDKNGTTYEKEVTSTAYNDWYKVGSKFPSTKHCEDGKAKG